MTRPKSKKGPQVLAPFPLASLYDGSCRDQPSTCPVSRRGGLSPCGRPGTRRAASTSLLGLAPGGVCLAGVPPRRRCALTAPFQPCRQRGHVRPRRLGGVFLWHFPAGFPGSDFPTTLPFGVRTFLEPGFSPARGCPASAHKVRFGCACGPPWLGSCACGGRVLSCVRD